METTETKKPLTPLEKKIAKLKEEAQANLEKEIEKVTKEENSKEARKNLEKKIKDEKASLEIQHNGYIKDFELEYGVKYILNSENDEKTKLDETKKITLKKKCEIASKELNELDELKFKLNDTKDGIIGAKGEKITSVMKITVNGKKETLSVRSFFAYLKPEATKEELDKLFPRKNDIAKEIR